MHTLFLIVQIILSVLVVESKIYNFFPKYINEEGFANIII